MTAIAILLGCTTVYCAIKWFNKHILALSIIYYLEKKGYTPPSKEEIEECSEIVTKHVIEDAFTSKKKKK